MQTECDGCLVDLTHSIRIKCADPACAVGDGVDLCPNCFCSGKEFGKHKRGHAYRVEVSNTHCNPSDLRAYNPLPLEGTSFLSYIHRGLGRGRVTLSFLFRGCGRLRFLSGNTYSSRESPNKVWATGKQSLSMLAPAQGRRLKTTTTQSILIHRTGRGPCVYPFFSLVGFYNS